MAKTFKWARLHVVIHGCAGRTLMDHDEGEFVFAEDAINREAVNAAKIHTLETQLKAARRELEILRAKHYG